ncbi:Fur family transcriptional regulator [Thiomicrospira sp. WB1]|uniref:Fur family transcriptional regulator n=1 Tax=Thiomicrospira sp. WB1 TaxID=1685380 RepID=UPI0007479716|nr:transcriptional repressor [Thiomicrospira sp. WB1]KUJ72404.1 hypothetical protein AVO41_00890 [Thiomicrospira sp. WB1]
MTAQIDERLQQAKRVCQQNGQRLTPIRAGVLQLLLESEQPLSAYELLAHYQTKHVSGAQPMTIYRALHFLQQQSLIHHLSSRRQYVACDHPHTHAAHRLTQLLLCDECGHTQEVPLEPHLSEAMQNHAQAHAFRLKQTELELHGLCAHCQQSEKEPSHV